ncbi:peptidoglycan-binding protein [Streptomyces zhaozhouensis]|uniref:peptidoglycan-binding protein n=1 Tax=Streptomyces zhaozhouensis TaxID=1300267 RepID=UPI00148517C2|nr:peptidoglycan-binding protein [Streptomyces zhaozhouensis]
MERLGAAPVDAPAGAARPAPSHRKPRSRNRASLAAGGAVAAVVGSAALAASFFHGAVRDRAVSDALPPVPSLVLPDGNGESGEGAAGEGDGHTPAPEEGAETAPEGSEGAEPPPEEPEPDATGEAPQPDPTPTERPDPPPTGPGPEPTPTPPTAPVPDEPEEPDDPEDPEDPDDPDPGDPEPDPSGSLKEGDEGPEVVELQERMLELRWVYRGTAHGSYDAPTREAVARLQSAYAVTDDPKGVYGPHTRELLESLTTGR